MSNWLIRRKWWIAAIAAVLAFVAALNFETIVFVFDMATAERRPALLNDAGWNDPATAHEFNKAFARGAAVESLLTWLAENRFEATVSKQGGHGSRRIAGLPCNETIDVDWTTGLAGTIDTARAVVREAGCL